MACISVCVYWLKLPGEMSSRSGDRFAFLVVAPKQYHSAVVVAVY